MNITNTARYIFVLISFALLSGGLAATSKAHELDTTSSPVETIILPHKGNERVHTFVSQNYRAEFVYSNSGASALDILIDKDHGTVKLHSEDINLKAVTFTYDSSKLGKIESAQYGNQEFYCVNQQLRSDLAYCSFNFEKQSNRDSNYGLVEVAGFVAVFLFGFLVFKIARGRAPASPADKPASPADKPAWPADKLPASTNNAKHSYFTKQNNHEDRRLLRSELKWLLAPIIIGLLISILTLWRGDLSLPLFFPINSPVLTTVPIKDAISSIDIVSVVISSFRYTVGLVFGGGIEARVYFSLIIILISTTYFFAAKRFLRLVSGKGIDKDSLVLNLVPLAASFFAVVNPFVATRLSAGHGKLLIAYALLSLLGVELIRTLKDEKELDLNTVLKLSIPATVIILISNHFAPILLVIGIIFLIIYSYKNRIDLSFKKAKLPVALILTELILLIFTVIQLISSFNTTREFNTTTLADWAPKPDSFYSIFSNLFSLNGAWVEDGLIPPAKDSIGAEWIVFAVVILGAVFAGLLILLRKNKTIGIFAAANIIALVILAAGYFAMFDVLSAPFKVFYDSGLFRGMRESQKFLFGVIWLYALLIALTVSYLYRRGKLVKQVIALALTFAVLFSSFVLSTHMFNLGGGKIKTCDYPAEIYENKALLNDSLTAILPNDHQYFVWCDIFTINPLEKIIDEKAKQLEDIEEFQSSDATGLVFMKHSAMTDEEINKLNNLNCKERTDTDELLICIN